ncbi:hypothetical protein GWI33_016064 [Rhynchophorus ferrugineus]|uniref:Uncharacterized protein n=1 Tax=Rhynchophorus ferrugineus TaxID=354439 RepID=A0A834MAQ1_RHYFE|nr:hypothetical protein GWI33_016064 [Rhynchophorus ferrugineus]
MGVQLFKSIISREEADRRFKYNKRAASMSDISDIRSLNKQMKMKENKYAREVTLHSTDLHRLKLLKAELDKTLDTNKSLESKMWNSEEKLVQYQKIFTEQSQLVTVTQQLDRKN